MAGTCVNPVLRICCPWIHKPAVFPWRLTLAIDGKKRCESCSANLLSLNTHTSSLPMVFNFGHWRQEPGVNLLSLNTHTSSLPMVFNFGHWRQEPGVNLLSLNTHTSSLPMVFNFGNWWQETGMNPVQQICCPWIHTPAMGSHATAGCPFAVIKSHNFWTGSDLPQRTVTFLVIF